MEFLVNNEILGTVRNFREKAGFRKYETRIFLGGRKEQFFSGHEPTRISFDYEGKWPECRREDVWSLRKDSGESETFFPVDLIRYDGQHLHVSGEIYPGSEASAD